MFTLNDAKAPHSVLAVTDGTDIVLAHAKLTQTCSLTQ